MKKPSHLSMGRLLHVTKVFQAAAAAVLSFGCIRAGGPRLKFPASYLTVADQFPSAVTEYRPGAQTTVPL